MGICFSHTASHTSQSIEAVAGPHQTRLAKLKLYIERGYSRSARMLEAAVAESVSHSPHELDIMLTTNQVV